ncbi:MAG: EF-Tu/IF-2/RF-3 family GTPase, partial [Phycisphaerae bacterium]
KIVADKPMDLCYVRVYSGVFKSGSRVFNAERGSKENISQMFRMFAKRREAISSAGPGEIVAVVGLKDSLTGDTLCDPKNACVLESIEFPDPVISVAVEPKIAKDRDAMAETLRRLSRQDPTFRYHVDAETGQTLISGMGELHLEVLVHKLRRDFRVEVNVGKPRVSFRETITQRAEAEGRFIRQLGKRDHYAVVRLGVEPFEHEPGGPHFAFENRMSDASVSAAYWPIIEQACRESMMQGVLAGYDMLNVRAVLLGGNEHETNSSEVAFENAARMAFHAACEKASPVLLEPVMRVQVVTPADYFGAVTGDLSSRRGLVVDTTYRGELRVIEADAPLAEMFGYATALRSLTQGRASWSMEPKGYEPVPPQVQKRMLESY